MRRLACIALAASLAICALTPVASAQQPSKLPETVTFQPDFTYGTSKKGTTLKLDLLVPKTQKSPAACVILFHGGAWVTGSRKDWTLLAARIAELGYVTAVVGYTLVPEATLTDQMEESRQALRWIHTNAKKRGIDPDRVAILASSSGAQLGGLLSLEVNRDRKFPTIRGMVMYAPVTDIPALYANYEKVGGWKGALAIKILHSVMEGTPKADADKYAKGSLAQQVDKHTPPTLIIHDKADSMVPFEQTEILVGKLKGLKVDVQLVTPTDVGHGYAESTRKHYDKPTAEFLERYLKAETTKR
jgi:acetyl esterase/lipase